MLLDKWQEKGTEKIELTRKYSYIIEESLRQMAALKIICMRDLKDAPTSFDKKFFEDQIEDCIQAVLDLEKELIRLDNFYRKNPQ